MTDAVETAVDAWGEKSMTELEAEDRLSYACEKVSDIQTDLCSTSFQLVRHEKLIWI